MKSRKGFTLIELLVISTILTIIVSILIGGCLFVGCIVKGVGVIDTEIDNRQDAHTQRLETNPPLYDVGDIVYHKATDAKMIVSKRYTFWNVVKEGWDIKVKDGGGWDKVGGFTINEREVKTTLEVPEL